MVLAICIACLIFAGTEWADAASDAVPPAASVSSGIASIYSKSDRPTASGEHMQAEKLTAAHRSLPFGTMVQITNRRNGRSVTVRITDRGPFARGRVIDVSPAAAQLLGFSGITPVTLVAQ